MRQYLQTFFYQRYFETYANLSKTAWFLLSLTLINASTLALIFFVSIYFSEILSFSPTQIGLLLSSYGGGMAVGGVIGGGLVDRYRPTSIACIALIMQSMAFLGLCYAMQITTLILILFTLGLSAYIFKTANQFLQLLLESAHNDQQNKIINLSHVASNLGLSISGIAIGLVTPAAFRHLFFTCSLMLLFLAMYLLSQVHALKQDQRSSENTVQIKRSVTPNSHILILLLLIVFIIGMLIAQLGTTYPLYIMQQFPLFGQRGVSILFIMDTILIVLFQAALMQSTKQFHPFFIIGFGALCMGLGMAALNLASTFYLAVIFGILWTIGEMLFIPSIQLQCFHYAASNKKGLSLGSFQSIYALSNIVGPMLGGVLYTLDNGQTLWQLSGSLGGLICIICIWYAAKNKC